MTDAEFRDLVRKMRNAQSEYFGNRTPDRLRAAKDYERRVDAALKEDSGEGLFK